MLLVVAVAAGGCGDPSPAVDAAPTADAAVDGDVDGAAGGCGDGVPQQGEACDDGNGTNGDGCDVNCTISACGNQVTGGAETCDDGGTVDGDGCAANCQVESGYQCQPMIPSVCSTVCGDGLTVGAETCDQGGGNQAPGDGCSATCQIEPGWSCTGAPSSCTRPCGNGRIDAGEACDDGNEVAGDGCGLTCQFDLGCAAGELPVVQTFAPATPAPLPNLSTSTFPVTVTQTGAVTRAAVYLPRITHPSISDLRLRLFSPANLARELRRDVITLGSDYVATLFDDRAPWPLESAGPPYTGAFRPSESLSTSPGLDLAGQNAAGNWTLAVTDVTSVTAGTLTGWSLLLCVAPAQPYCGDGTRNGAEECDDGNPNDTDQCSNACQVADGCGDGALDAGEQCDDGNGVSGDGCSAACAIDVACAPGEVPVTVSASPGLAIPPGSVTGVTSDVTVPTAGAVTKLLVQVDIAHPRASELSLALIAPVGVERRLITGTNSSTSADFRATQFADAGRPIEFGVTPPFTGRFAPVQSLSTAIGFDLRNTRSAGTWTLRAFNPYDQNRTGTLERWTLTACVAPAAPACGDGVRNGTDECDDGNQTNTDGCSNLCQIADGCGDGGLDPGESCDDGNGSSGDGCSNTCVRDIGCGPGQVVVDVTNPTISAIPDGGTLIQPVTVTTTGLVRRVIVGVDVTHPQNADLGFRLLPPRGRQRLLTGGGSGANRRASLFSDDAPASTSLVAPYTGTARPLDLLTGYDALGGAQAAGTWRLLVNDRTSGQTGTLDGWSLALCVEPGTAAVCGNGVVEDGETCDDRNVSGGDGCSACQVELACGAGETATRVTFDGPPVAIPDNLAAGVNSQVTGPTGVVRKVVLGVGTISHAEISNLDVRLVSPGGTAVSLLSSGPATRGPDLVSTVFDDGATVSTSALSSQSAPHRGHFRPAAPLASHVGQAAAGSWRLSVADRSPNALGVVQSWTLGLCVQ